MNEKNLIWLTIEGIDKKEILEGMGFKIDNTGILFLEGKEIKAIDNPEISVKASDVKAIVPFSDSMAVITDLSEMELIFPSE